MKTVLKFVKHNAWSLIFLAVAVHRLVAFVLDTHTAAEASAFASGLVVVLASVAAYRWMGVTLTSAGRHRAARQ